MKSKIIPSASVALPALSFCAYRTAAQKIPADVLRVVPRAGARLYSADPAD